MIRPSFSLFAERREIFLSDVIRRSHFAIITTFTCLLENAVCVVLKMPARFPEEKRVAALRMWLSGTSQRNIATVLDLHLATVRIICAFREEGRICNVARNCVRKTTAEEDAALVQVAEANPFMTAGQHIAQRRVGQKTALGRRSAKSTCCPKAVSFGRRNSKMTGFCPGSSSLGSR